MSSSMEAINLAIMSVTIRNPFVGNFLLRINFEESELTDKVYISEKTVIFYNPEYIERFDAESMRYLMYFIFFVLINRISYRLNKDSKTEEDFNLQHIAMESCLNSYVSSLGVVKFDVDGIKLFSRLGKVSLDFNYSTYFDFLSSDISKVDPHCETLVDIKHNKSLEEKAKLYFASKSAADNSINQNIKQSIKNIGGVKSETFKRSLSKISNSDFFSSENIINFYYEGNGVVNWKEHVKSKISSSFKGEYELFPNQNMMFFGRVLPLMPRRMGGKMIDISVAIDVSYSISEEDIRVFINEIFNIVSVFNNYKLRFWTFSCEVNESSYIEFNSDENTIDKNHQFGIDIGGTTVFENNWVFMKDRKIKPDCLVVFTDGYPNYTWGDPKYCDTIFIVLDREDTFDSKSVPDFGKTLIIKDI